MLYSKYQKSALYIFFKKIRYNAKSEILNDKEKFYLKGKVKQIEKIYLDKGEDKFELNTREIKIFNQYGNLLEEHYNNTPVLFKLYSYDSENKLSITKSYKEEDVILEEEYFNYENDFLKSKRVYSKENYEEFYDYDFNGNLISVDKFYDNLDDVTITYNYYKNGKIKESFMFMNSRFIKKTKINYSNLNGLKIVETIISSEDLFTKKLETFNSNGDIASIKSLSSFGEFEKTFIYKYDKNFNWTERLEYISGKLIEKINANIVYF